jgi:hypothetical protein
MGIVQDKGACPGLYCSLHRRVDVASQPTPRGAIVWRGLGVSYGPARIATLTTSDDARGSLYVG